MADMETIPYLRKGDRVALAAPARAVSPDEVAAAVAEISSWGLDVVVPDGLYEREGQLAGSDVHRAMLMQRLLDDDSIRAIICCRGGYGSVRIVDRLDFTRFSLKPKWIVGYSDVTVLHSHIHSTLGLPTLHATMPINFGSAPTPATESLRRALFGEKIEYRWDASFSVPHPSSVEGVVVGGNLSILYSLLGSRSQVDTRGKILLIEDLDEYLYHIDRMMQALRRVDMLSGIKALIVGGLSDMHDNTIPFGRTAEQIVAEVVAGYGYPVLFGAPFGHIGDGNMALPLGRMARLEMGDAGNVTLSLKDE